MLRFLSLFLTLTACLSVPALAATPETPLKFFSSHVDVIIRLKEPDRTLEKVTGLVNKVQPGAGDALKSQQSAGLGALVSNPTLTGVDQTRDWYAGIYFLPDEAPVVVFAIPAIDTDDLVSAVGEMTTQVQGKWVLYTDAEKIPEVDSSASAETQLGAGQIASLLSGDLNIYVNTEHVTEIYADQIDVARNRVLENLNQLRFLPSQGDIDPQVMIDMYGSLAEALFQAVDDAQTSLASLTITDSDLVFSKQVAFADASKTSHFLARNKPDAMADLDHLPAGAQLYYGASGAMKEFIRSSVTMTFGMMNDKSLSEKIEQSLKLLDPVTYGATVASLAISQTSESPFQAVMIVNASPIDDVRKFSRTVAEAVGTLENNSISQTSSLKVDAETYGSHQVDLVEVKQEIKPDAPTGELQRKLHNLMFGGDTMQTRTAYLDKQYVSTVGGGQKPMKDFLAGLESGKSSSLKKFREPLMKEANFLMFMDLPRFSGDFLSLAAERMEGFPIPLNAQMISSLNLKPSYVGIAVGSTPNTARLELRLPVEQIIGVSKIGVLIGTTMRGGL